MPATIIKPGSRYRGTCPSCDCTFEVQRGDTMSHQELTSAPGAELQTYAHVLLASCPECMTRTKVAEPQQPDVLKALAVDQIAARQNSTLTEGGSPVFDKDPYAPTIADLEIVKLVGDLGFARQSLKEANEELRQWHEAFGTTKPQEALDRLRNAEYIVHKFVNPNQPLL